MPDRVPMLLKVFKVELEETENSVLCLVDYYSKRFQKDEITPYVWMENRALLLREISCVKELESDLSDWSPPEGALPAEALDAVRVYLKKLVEERGYPELVSLVVDRIGDKISRYLD